MSENSKLNGIINTSLSNIKEIIDVNTVVGEPIQTAGGTVIIPVSKVSLAYVSGGVDYIGKNTAPEKGMGFGGGGGTGVTLTPVGFLVTRVDGSTEYLPVIPGEKAAPPPEKVDTVISLIEKAPDIVKRVKNFIDMVNPQPPAKIEEEDKAE